MAGGVKKDSEQKATDLPNDTEMRAVAAASTADDARPAPVEKEGEKEEKKEGAPEGETPKEDEKEGEKPKEPTPQELLDKQLKGEEELTSEEDEKLKEALEKNGMDKETSKKIKDALGKDSSLSPDEKKHLGELLQKALDGKLTSDEAKELSGLVTKATQPAPLPEAASAGSMMGMPMGGEAPAGPMGGVPGGSMREATAPAPAPAPALPSYDGGRADQVAVTGEPPNVHIVSYSVNNCSMDQLVQDGALTEMGDQVAKSMATTLDNSSRTEGVKSFKSNGASLVFDQAVARALVAMNSQVDLRSPDNSRSLTSEARAAAAPAPLPSYASRTQESAKEGVVVDGNPPIARKIDGGQVSYSVKDCSVDQLVQNSALTETGDQAAKSMATALNNNREGARSFTSNGASPVFDQAVARALVAMNSKVDLRSPDNSRSLTSEARTEAAATASATPAAVAAQAQRGSQPEIKSPAAPLPAAAPASAAAKPQAASPAAPSAAPTPMSPR